MGIVWEAYHKGVPSLGAPENPIDIGEAYFQVRTGSFRECIPNFIPNTLFGSFVCIWVFPKTCNLT